MPFMIIHTFHSMIVINISVGRSLSLERTYHIGLCVYIFRVTIFSDGMKFQNSKAQRVRGNQGLIVQHQYAPTHICVGSRMHYSRVPPHCPQDMGVCMQDRAAADSEMGTVVRRTASGSYSDVCLLVPPSEAHASMTACLLIVATLVSELPIQFVLILAPSVADTRNLNL
jgi:hypothetical protein